MVEATFTKVFEVVTPVKSKKYTWYEEQWVKCITTNHQSSDPEQDSAPAEKLPLSNPRLHDVVDDMKEDVEDNRMKPQQQELVKDEEEKY